MYNKSFCLSCFWVRLGGPQMATSDLTCSPPGHSKVKGQGQLAVLLLNAKCVESDAWLSWSSPQRAEAYSWAVCSTWTDQLATDVSEDGSLLSAEGVRRLLDGMCWLPPPSPWVSARQRLWQSDSTQTRISPKHHFTHSNEGPAAGQEDKNDSLMRLCPVSASVSFIWPLAPLFIPLSKLWAQIAPFKREFWQIVENDTFIRESRAVGMQQE